MTLAPSLPPAQEKAPVRRAMPIPRRKRKAADTPEGDDQASTPQPPEGKRARLATEESTLRSLQLLPAVCTSLHQTPYPSFIVILYTLILRFLFTVRFIDMRLSFQYMPLAFCIKTLHCVCCLQLLSQFWSRVWLLGATRRWSFS